MNQKGCMDNIFKLNKRCMEQLKELVSSLIGQDDDDAKDTKDEKIYRIHKTQRKNLYSLWMH